MNRVRELLVDLVVSLSNHAPSHTHSDGMAISLDTGASMRRSNVVKPTNLSIGIEGASRELEAAACIAARIVITTPVSQLLQVLLNQLPPFSSTLPSLAVRKHLESTNIAGPTVELGVCSAASRNYPDIAPFYPAAINPSIIQPLRPESMLYAFG